MKVRLSLSLVIAACLIFIAAGQGFSQEENAPKELVAPTATDVQEGAGTLWVWGEVTSLDTENKIIVVKYLDYETDQEKEISIGVSDKTTYENIKSLEEIKPQDSVSIDYTVGPDSKNIATNISLEKAESQPMPSETKTTSPDSEPAPAIKPDNPDTQAAPQEAQPVMPREQ